MGKVLTNAILSEEWRLLLEQIKSDSRKMGSSKIESGDDL